MKLFSKKQIMIFSSLACGVVALATFNNMTPANVDLMELKEESRALSVKLRAKNTRLVRQMLTKHKVLVSDYIAKKVVATSCSHLLANDSNMPSGDYVLFPQGDVLRRSVYRCIVNAGRITRAEKIRDLVESAPERNVASAPAQVPTDNVVQTCESIDYKSKTCAVSDLAKLPELKQQLSKANCVLNESYFVDFKGIKVEKGCRATFEVSKFRLVAAAATKPSESTNQSPPKHIFERRSGSDR